MVTDVEIQQVDIFPDPLGVRGLGQQFGLAGMAHGDQELACLLGQLHHRRDLAGLDDRRGQEDPFDAGRDHRLGLGNGRHRDAPRTERT